jgi:hypothetical protein
MTEQPQETPPQKTYDGSIGDMVKSLINSIIKDSQDTYGDTPLEKVRNQLKFNTGGDTLAGITALSAYMSARSSERQATALEALAKTASKLQVADSLDTNAQAIVDQRESKRDYLATTYSLPFKTLAVLWAMRGMLMDASIKSLSRPERFDPYRRLSTEEIAWSLRLAPEGLWESLPKTADGGIDYEILEDFDIMHYGGADDAPDDWLYGG